VPVASPLASLGDLVWLDTLEDGIQGADELGVQGVTVRLLQGGNVISTTVTDENGFYLFDKLQPGDYVVCFGLPEDYDFTNANVGGDDEKDSDASQTDGCTEVITLEIGENDRSWDAGLVQIEPTAEEEVDQPGSPQQLFLPSLRNNEAGSAAAQTSAVPAQGGESADSVYLPTTSK
jgi:hypothetical protein